MRRRKNTLKSLIKLHRFRLDQVRKDVIEQQAMHDETENEINSTLVSMSNERHLVASEPVYYQSLGYYLSAAQYKVDLYTHKLQTVARALDANRERLSEAFQDVKRYEIALESHEASDLEQERVNERKFMDEISGRSKPGKR